MILQRLIDTLERHEGLRLKPYKDTVGKLTIGIGRNLDDKGLSRVEADYLVRNDIEEAEEDVLVLVPSFEVLDSVRQEALVNMAFNLGRSRMAQFKKMLAAIEAKDWDRTAAEALDSRWARQVGQRAQDIAFMLQTGQVSAE